MHGFDYKDTMFINQNTWTTILNFDLILTLFSWLYDFLIWYFSSKKFQNKVEKIMKEIYQMIT